ncbi:hypothetical protein ADN00_01735 [Ornatilinea apprima]|uniref:Histidine kinase domain-containing protein n=1 Tax=Ornatilinea apprima TaxID=1134406 RepID=A0A0P6YEQ5_9CHLR|nr:GAF domain-containing protein [Ornatilinea apprima]KPL80588.1 hypothetical protein ADN00_01735 [Ornatilinea apprima]
MDTLSCEQLEERMASLHRASVDLVKESSLDALLKRIAEEACRQARARYAAVGVLGENGELEQFVPVGMLPEDIAKMPHPPRGLGLIGELMRADEPMRLPDIGSDPRSAGFPKHHPQMNSFLGVPILYGGEHLGQIYITNKIDGGEFTEADEQIIQTFAAYAATAIRNAKLYAKLMENEADLTQKNRNLALINDLAAALASSTDIDQILERSIHQVLESLQLEVGEVYLIQGDSKRLSLVHHQGSPVRKLWSQPQFRMGEGAVGQAAESGAPMHIHIPGSDTRKLDYSVTEHHLTQIVCFPLNGRQGVQGVLCVGTQRPRPIDETEKQFIEAISSWVGTALENVHLSLQQRRLAVLEERERIGMDLHDGVIQSIYAVGLILEHARLLMREDPDKAYNRIVQAIDSLNSTIRDIRAYILDLRPHQLHDENLLQGIRRLVSEFRANTLVEVSLQGPADGLADLPDAPALALFHICQESLANAAKHARAHHVYVNLWRTVDRALLEVRDDGRGFEPDEVRLALGHGLPNMQTRARNVGGDVDISSEPGEGTTVLAWVPHSNES